MSLIVAESIKKDHRMGDITVSALKGLSEFAEKLYDYRVELRARYYF